MSEFDEIPIDDDVVRSSNVIKGDAYNESRKKFKNGRIEKGTCRDCGWLKPTNGVVCENCFIKRKQFGDRRAAKLKLANKCQQCMAALSDDREGKTLCINCHNRTVKTYRNRRKVNKIFIINHFGGKCVDCGEKDIRCLTLDHKNNNGNVDCASPNAKKKRIISTEWYARLKRQIENKEQVEELQLLCANCHFKKDLSPWWFEEQENA